MKAAWELIAHSKKFGKKIKPNFKLAKGYKTLIFVNNKTKEFQTVPPKERFGWEQFEGFLLIANKNMPAKDGYPAVKKGEYGGYIVHPESLDKYTDSWVYDGFVKTSKKKAPEGARFNELDTEYGVYWEK